VVPVMLGGTAGTSTAIDVRPSNGGAASTPAALVTVNCTSRGYGVGLRRVLLKVTLRRAVWKSASVVLAAPDSVRTPVAASNTLVMPPIGVNARMSEVASNRPVKATVARTIGSAVLVALIVNAGAMSRGSAPVYGPYGICASTISCSSSLTKAAVRSGPPDAVRAAIAAGAVFDTEMVRVSRTCSGRLRPF
jgi:hypothetical protein